eukprot:6394941-Pyramimonas_sp.AAC.1
MIQLTVASTSFSTPEELSRRRVCNRAAALIAFAMRDLEAEKNQPITQYIIKSLIFKQIAGEAFSQTDLDKLSPPSRQIQNIELLRDVARAAQGRIREGHPREAALPKRIGAAILSTRSDIGHSACG